MKQQKTSKKQHTYQVQYYDTDVEDSKGDGFIKVKATSEEEAICKIQKQHPKWIIFYAIRM
jgi:hypothetical protein